MWLRNVISTNQKTKILFVRALLLPLSVPTVMDRGSTLLHTDYILYYKDEQSTWREIVFPVPEQKEYELSNLRKGSQYQLYMRAASKRGTSDPSDVLTVRTECKSFSDCVSCAPRVSVYPDMLQWNKNAIRSERLEKSNGSGNRRNSGRERNSCGFLRPSLGARSPTEHAVKERNHLSPIERHDRP